MTTVSLTLNEIYDLAKKTLLANGCDDETASILSELITDGEIILTSGFPLPFILPLFRPET